MGKTRFDTNWLSLTDANEVAYSNYIRYDEGNVATITHAKCIWCNKIIAFDNRGVTAFRDHSKSTKHADLSRIKMSAAQLRIRAPVTSQEPSEGSSQPTLQLYVQNEETLEKEIVWTIHAVMKNASFNATEKDTAVLRQIAPNDLGKISLTRQKMTHLTNEALGPFFKSLFLDDLKGQYFSLLFDETDSANKSKELAILVKYFSPTLKKLQIFHLETSFIGKATADILHGRIKEAFQRNQLSYNRLVMICNDGPNVNKSVTRKVNGELIADRGYGMIDNGTCVVHILHNAFRNAIKAFGFNTSNLAKYLYYYFETPAKWEDFIASSKGRPKRFQKHIETRWASLGPAAKILADNFVHLLPLKKKLADVKKKTFYEEEILKILTLPDIKEEILFVIESAAEMERLIKFLETNDFILFDIFETIRQFVERMLARVCNPDKIVDVIQTASFEENRFVRVESIIVFPKVVESAGPNIDWNKFKLKIRKHIVECISHLFKKNTMNKFLELVGSLKPARLLEDQNNLQNVVTLVELIGFGLEKARIYEELVLIRMRLNPEVINGAEDDLDIYRTIFTAGNFSQTEKLINVVSCVSHSNAEIERRFADSKHVMEDNQSNMSSDTFNSRKTVKNGMIFYENKLTNFKVTKDLMLKAKFARKNYEAKLEEQKRKIESDNEKQKDDDKKKVMDRIRKQQEAVGTKRKAKEELECLIQEKIKKATSDHPEISYLKVLLNEKERLAEEEQKETKKLDSMRSI